MFLDCSSLIAENPPRPSNGIAVTDIDGDGALELVVAGYRTANLVLKWVDGRLVDVADPSLADPTGPALGLAAADVDGDGREELYIVNSDRTTGAKDMADRLFACFGKHWLDLFAQAENAGAANHTAAGAVAAVDRWGHGRYGFLVATDGGPLRLYELTRRGRLEDGAEEAGLDSIGAARGVTVLPIVSDHMDVVTVNDGGPNQLFRNLGDGNFEEIAEERGIADSRPSGRAVTALDVDGDGLFDLAVGTWDGAQRLFHQRMGGSFIESANADLSMPGRIFTVVAADFDNDGYEELFFHAHGEPNRLFGWRNDQWQELELGDAAEPKGLGTGAIAADIDGDGRLELVLAHGNTHGAPDGAAQPLSVYRPAASNNGWLRVQPLTPFGAPARGAVVSLSAGGRRQRRAVCAGSGYLCQGEPVAHFGLGPLHQVEQIEVRWPDGTVVTVDDPPADRLLVIPYPPE
ncbi:CRTAC1 family protein [Azospirillum sp. YIM B02556]|uniref:CRTAC1 family protein n=1 Tax=Azospirillum endophyticum TaxID=2800326 RepID=A0ABS1FCT8_9PROT|nr:CRTAC1 family protein [Azospirillum endophyticum]MBK1841212.1 CRTAC1 family protein [Azospirillum endophyticum]